MSPKELEKLKKAGEIASKTVAHARSFIKKDMPLLKIVDEIESYIVSLGGQPAFPVNLSINEIAAHATPSHDDSEVAHGLLKVDIGVHIEGYIADTAFTLDLENNKENKDLIEAAESGLQNAISLLQNNPKAKIREIGSAISRSITSRNALPIANLSGHSIEQNEIHAGITIPNYDNAQERHLDPGVYAIEPFATISSGAGSVRDGKPSGIYMMTSESPVRDSFAREILRHIQEEYSTRPFCSRWLVRAHGTRSLLALRFLEQAGILHHYAQLIENSKSKVAQAEHTIVLTGKEAIIITA